MCGISGIYNFNSAPADKQLLNNMNKMIMHRGPDGEGVFV